MKLEFDWFGTDALEKSVFNKVKLNANQLIPFIENSGYFNASSSNRKTTISIIIIDDSEIKRINNSFRNKSIATDVLTFSYLNNSDPSPDLEKQTDAEIYISHETASRQAESHNVNNEEELTLLVIHGILHAFGMDHEISENERNKMKSREYECLQYLGLKHVNSLIN